MDYRNVGQVLRAEISTSGSGQPAMLGFRGCFVNATVSGSGLL
jgi:hypothetical protein